METKETKKLKAKRDRLIKERNKFRKMLDKRNKQIGEISAEILEKEKPAHKWRQEIEKPKTFLQALAV